MQICRAIQKLKYDGYGTLYYEDDAVNGPIQYEGQFKQGLADGKGKHYSDNELEYDGEWKKDERHGFGKAFVNDKVIYSGLWANDEPLKAPKRKITK